MVSIHKQNKKEKVKLSQLNDIIIYLTSNGVHFDYIVAEQHGYYNQLHCHCMVRYKGRYLPLSKYKLGTSWYRIHWTPIKDHRGCMHYLEKHIKESREYIAMLRNGMVREASNMEMIDSNRTTEATLIPLDGLRMVQNLTEVA